MCNSYSVWCCSLFLMSLRFFLSSKWPWTQTWHWRINTQKQQWNLIPYLVSGNAPFSTARLPGVDRVNTNRQRGRRESRLERERESQRQYYNCKVVPSDFLLRKAKSFAAMSLAQWDTLEWNTTGATVQMTRVCVCVCLCVCAQSLAFVCP